MYKNIISHLCTLYFAFKSILPNYYVLTLLYLVAAVVIASAQLRVLSTVLECGGLSPVARAINTALVYHRPLDALLMSGRTGHLQLYSTASDKVLYNVSIC